MKDLKEKIKIFEEDFDDFRTFVRFWNLRNSYFVNLTLTEIDGKLFDKDGKMVFDRVISFDYVNDYLCNIEDKEPDKFRIYNNMRKCYIKKRKRVFDRNQFILHNYKYVGFITLTFNDYNLSLKYDTRRKNIIKYLRMFDSYICNIDYGDTDEYVDSHGVLKVGTHREHYHALIGCNTLNKFLNYHKWSGGYYYLEEVKRTDDDKVRLSKYLVKLTHHNLKLSTKGNNLIYSKNLKEV